MKRLHLHVSVPDLHQSIQFYETLFGAPPTVVKDDYAKWMLDDPRVNLAISQLPGRTAGVDHVGIQVDSPAELGELASRLKAAGAQTFDEEATTCCYARSDKSWVADPAGVRWETFYTFGEATTYGDDPAMAALEAQVGGGSACCAPKAEALPPVAAGACCG
ncbi:MAG: glyoxalase/bleomycin resistance/dioxygenase family protein [Phenylobacterium zucineum]|nr:MAG: glyoxalase/bleomycin resistance/dioxygenase family protein [Phenylobacterium zucineum]